MGSKGRKIHYEQLLPVLFALVIVAIPIVPNAYAETTTIPTDSFSESLVVNEGDTFVIEPGLEVHAGSITNNGTIMNRGSIMSIEIINGGIIENYGFLSSESKTSNDGGIIENYGILRFNGERENFYNMNGGTINIKENARFEFSRQGSYEPHSLYNDASSLVDNYGTVALTGYLGMTIQNEGSLYQQCGATYTIPVYGNPVIDKCVSAPPGGDGKIVFVSARDAVPPNQANTEIYIMNADGTGQTRLTYDPSVDVSPSLSPDGKKIVFSSNRAVSQSGFYGIFVMNADGSGQTLLTNSTIGGYSPTWSPDGDNIAFSSDAVYVMNSDGSGLTGIFGSDSALIGGQIKWSPDGAKITFVDNVNGNYEIFVIDADGNDQPINLTNNPASDGDPEWSPDGTKIAFTSLRDPSAEIYVMDADDGSNQVRLSVSNGTGTVKDIDGDPEWSPDGKKIAFVAYRDGQDAEIYVMNSDGSGKIDITNDPFNAHDTEPDWGVQPPGSNDPDAVDDSDATDQDESVTTDVLANDSDAEGDTLSVTTVSDPANGSTTNNGDGTVTYSPDSGFTGTDTYQYTISDGNGGTDTATVTITVDTVIPPPPTDELFCGRTIDDFDNVIDGDSDDNLLKGSAQDDLIRGFAGDDRIFGKGGNDCLKGYEGDDRIWGGDGNDFILGLDGSDKLVGDAGSDTIFGNAGDDNAWGNAGDDMLIGESGNDKLHGDAGNDSIYGNAGEDYLWGGQDNDIMTGDSDDDKLVGDDGSDHMWGGDGDDFLIGLAGNDKLVGDSGNDRLYGNTDDDSIYDDLGDDSLNGGDDSDNCFDATGTNNIFNCEKQLDDDNHASHQNINLTIDRDVDEPYEEGDDVVIEGTIDDVQDNLDSVEITIEDSENDEVESQSVDLGSSDNFDLFYNIGGSDPDGAYTVEVEYDTERAFSYFIVDNDNDSILVVLDDTNYEAGDEIEITGQVDNVVSGETEVQITVLDPNNDEIIDQDNAELGEGTLSGDEFEYTFDLDSDADHGRYAVIVSYDNDDQQGWALFEIEDDDSGGGSSGGGNGDSGTDGDIEAEIGEATYAPGHTVSVTGTIDNYDTANELEIIVEGPDGAEIESDNDATVQNDGDFEFEFELDNNADEGEYDVTFTYDTDELALAFDVENP